MKKVIGINFSQFYFLLRGVAQLQEVHRNTDSVGFRPCRVISGSTGSGTRLTKGVCSSAASHLSLKERSRQKPSSHSRKVAGERPRVFTTKNRPAHEEQVRQCDTLVDDGRGLGQLAGLAGRLEMDQRALRLAGRSGPRGFYKVVHADMPVNDQQT